MNKWWQNAVIYQIYPRSFCDSNGDGIGDIPGIISKLGYLAELGVNVLWLSPVYLSPNDDNGYDISDYKAINPEFGTMQDMEMLIASAKEHGLKIVMDLVINHTSDEHKWFVGSKNEQSAYRDYYFWRKGKNNKLPNNWTGFFGGKVWEKDSVSDSYYLHLFSKKQPDLNYHNPKVREEIKQVMRFWLDKGVCGFRCDVINIIWKSSLENGKKRFILTGSEHYISQEGAHEILRELRRDVLDNYDCFTVGETVFVTPKMARDLCEENRGELDMVFSFEHMEVDQLIVKWFKIPFKPKKLFDVLSVWQNSLTWNANYFENHDQPRAISRFCDTKNYWSEGAKLIAVLLFCLRGTPFVFEGQEIGMTNFDFIGMQQIQDVESHNIYALAKKFIPKGMLWKMIKATSRDNARTPMQWSALSGAGFTEGKAWLGINSNYKQINAESQLNEKDSIYNFYKKMIAFRSSSPVLLEGSFEKLYADNKIFVFRRKLGKDSFTVLLNFSGKSVSYTAKGDTIISTYENSYSGNLMPWEGVVLCDKA